ncbi:eukaryotic translation initiation factor 2, subunit 3 gamma, 52kDa [Phellopilus nigrolimitatus]|nr:eukaryotic translation initiation factor 2, subunit 3 gamma, 52kDa [Phellopilus nigrolimitatus]
MLNVAAVMDAAHLLIAGDELCPQPQTSELAAKAQVLEHQKSTIAFVKGTVAEASPIWIPILVRDFTSSPRLIVIRSFDVNKPGAEVGELMSGIVCRSIFTSMPTLSMCFEIRPGIFTKDTQGCRKDEHVQQDKPPDLQPHSHAARENNQLQFVMPGGLIGVGTMINPTLPCGQARRAGARRSGQAAPDLHRLFLLWCLSGVKTEDKKMAKVTKLMKNDLLLINIGSTTSRCSHILPAPRCPALCQHLPHESHFILVTAFKQRNLNLY